MSPKQLYSPKTAFTKHWQSTGKHINGMWRQCFKCSCSLCLLLINVFSRLFLSIMKQNSRSVNSNSIFHSFILTYYTGKNDDFQAVISHASSLCFSNRNCQIFS